MPNTVRPIQVSSAGGAVSVRVADMRHPQAIEARVYRFANASTNEGLAGRITEGMSEVLLGSPAAINGKFFLVDGNVVPFGDDPPTPFQVVVTVLQGGHEIDSAVPGDNGSGSIGKDPVPFRFPFSVSVA
jgi:hypothetical protein